VTPLALVAGGLLLVVVDVRVGVLDVVPDLLGWPLVAYGLLRLPRVSGWFTAGVVTSMVGTLLAVPSLAPVGTGVLVPVGDVLVTVVVFTTCSGIREVAEPEATRYAADRLRWTALAVSGATVALWLGTRGLHGGAGGSGAPEVVLVVLALGVLAVVGWFLVFLWTHRHETGLAPDAGDARP
jgi:hypothetical protein